MNWTAYLDGYCERLAPGLWGEPLNSLSNLAFLIAAIAVWRQPKGRVFAVLIGLVFLGSTAFHLLATRWSAAADTGFILVFVLYYAAVFPHLFFGVSRRLSWLAIPVFLAFTAVVASLGGGMYLSALIGLVVFAVVLKGEHRRRFAIAAGVFGVSLSFRTADHTVCGNFPAGTHFVWHLLNGLVLYLTATAATKKAASEPDAALPAKSD
ncbi:hypothetical protein [Amycolatopsis azurea]|uniref:Membrane protein, putative n=1 Tax=Amycolatopsis azurea DSM 43854 TaxID=1238180 RepID=M2PSK1_9PSEU|nr:hypothetical protein [Amycolatopsis azurea]EMD22485.1 membrane protein, putative [Amycolatopsis azurea DSM 43854]OOC00887.1 hypothetical protein B0293_40515 [Amycolatopsis azurea DSM 43854]